jgi:hypothetical protein
LPAVTAYMKRTISVTILVVLIQISIAGVGKAAVDEGNSTNSNQQGVGCAGNGLELTHPSGVDSMLASRQLNCAGNVGADIWISIWVTRTVSGQTTEYDRIDVGPGEPYLCTNTFQCSAIISASGMPGGFYQVLSTASFRASPDGNVVNFSMQGIFWTIPGGGPNRPNP